VTFERLDIVFDRLAVVFERVDAVFTLLAAVFERPAVVLAVPRLAAVLVFDRLATVFAFELPALLLFELLLRLACVLLLAISSSFTDPRNRSRVALRRRVKRRDAECRPGHDATRRCAEKPAGRPS
jgi:hypothetical protein